MHRGGGREANVTVKVLLLFLHLLGCAQGRNHGNVCLCAGVKVTYCLHWLAFCDVTIFLLIMSNYNIPKPIDHVFLSSQLYSPEGVVLLPS